jgi:hypothetical protein
MVNFIGSLASFAFIAALALARPAFAALEQDATTSAVAEQPIMVVLPRDQRLEAIGAAMTQCWASAEAMEAEVQAYISALESNTNPDLVDYFTERAEVASENLGAFNGHCDGLMRLYWKVHI